LSVDRDAWCTYRITIEDTDLKASCIVYDHLFLDINARKGTHFFVNLLNETVREFRGWEGQKAWRSLEGHLLITVESAPTGMALFKIQLLQKAGGWGWNVQTELSLDVVQRERAASELARFFAQTPE
jgi:hypothetical protein